jgi:purine-nucleoside phosphorylase
MARNVAPDCGAQAEELASAIRTRSAARPRIAVIAGSGLGGFVRSVRAHQAIPYSDLPHVGASTVVGHSGNLVHGDIGEFPIWVLNGRRHLYEGVAPTESTLLLRALLLDPELRIVIISNAAGGLNPCFAVGDLMLISDHINWMFRNPLIGPNRDDWGARFPDLSDVYSKRLRGIARETGLEIGIVLREGVYLAGHGPSYETRAEVAMLRTVFQADAVGMSTAPEALVAAHAGREVLGISFISNLLTAPATTTHEEVMANAKKVEDKFARLLCAMIPKL